ncbi:MAG: hypothetical protein ACXVB0_06900 [Mucilaginibacter sp.]
MKPYLFLTCFVMLLAFRASAQQRYYIGMHPNADHVTRYRGQDVMIYDTVRSIKKISSTAVSLIFESDPLQHGVRVILVGKLALKKATALLGTEAAFYGRLKLHARHLSLTISNFKEIGSGPGCNCQAGEPNRDILIDTVKK